MTMELRSLIGLSVQELETALAGAGVDPKACRMRARQLWNWIYVHGARDFAAMGNLGKDFRALLSNHFTLARPGIVTEQISSDGARKWPICGGPGVAVETAISPGQSRGTLARSRECGRRLDSARCPTGPRTL